MYFASSRTAKEMSGRVQFERYILYTFQLVHEMGVARLLVVHRPFSDTWWIIDAMLDKEFSRSCSFAFGSRRGFVRCIVLGLSSEIDGPSSGVCDILGATRCLRHR